MVRSQVRGIKGGQDRKARYHHGDLRESLIAATQALVVERGAEHFTLADACRFAGVSTAAPYKHFRDKQEILEIVCQRGFHTLRQVMVERAAAAGEGSLAALLDIGRTYVAFAQANPNLFRLMFGQNSDLKSSGIVDQAGTGCFTYVIEQVALFSSRKRQKADPRMLALKLWTFVHGAACLLIDKDYEKVAPDLDIDALLDAATPGLLGQ